MLCKVQSVNSNFDQLSLYLPHYAAQQKDIELGYPGSDSTLQPFVLSSAVWYTNTTAENWQRNATNTLTFSSPGRN
jgi:hypothetical protein